MIVKQVINGKVCNLDTTILRLKDIRKQIDDISDPDEIKRILDEFIDVVSKEVH